MKILTARRIVSSVKERKPQGILNLVSYVCAALSYYSRVCDVKPEIWIELVPGYMFMVEYFPLSFTFNVYKFTPTSFMYIGDVKAIEL